MDHTTLALIIFPPILMFLLGIMVTDYRHELKGEK